MTRVIVCSMVLLVTNGVFAAASDSASAPKLADPQATAQTQALYRNLHRLASEGVMFGHQDTLAYGVGWKADADSFDSDVKRVCGKFPAVFGWDLGHIGEPANIDGVPFGNMKVWIARAYAQGGINTISWHARIPGSTQSSWTREKAVPRLLPGGDLHETYVAKLDEVAGFLGDLKGPDGEAVPVIFRPFHEHTGDWFWWGAAHCTPEQYKQLWRFTMNYLHRTKGLHNLITAYSPDRFGDRDEYLERYPGDDVIDIMGHDNYGDLSSANTAGRIRTALETLVSLAQEHDKVAALTETGINQSDADTHWWTDVLLDG